jgi:peptidase E
MTKYILNSGGLRNNPESARQFNLEIIKGLGLAPRLLFCHFAAAREYWEEKFADYTERFQAALGPEIRPQFTLAYPDKFAEQIKNNDAIVIHGGDDTLLQYWLKQYDLPTLWLGKVVAGSSAGADALVRHFWTCDWRQCKDGLGLLPIKFIPHYQSAYGQNDPRGPINWEQAYDELAQYGDTALPIHALEEGKFIIMEK